MNKTQLLRVQSLPAKPGERRPTGVRQLRGLAFEAGAIDGIADDRVADMGEMDADLMGPAGFQPAGNEADHAERRLQPPMGHRVATALLRDDGHFLALARMAPERRVDRSLRHGRAPPDER